MMATVPHVTSGLGLRKFQADGFLLTRVYHEFNTQQLIRSAHKANLRVLYGSENKQRLFPYTALTDSCFYNRDGVCLLRGTGLDIKYNSGRRKLKEARV